MAQWVVIGQSLMGRSILPQWFGVHVALTFDQMVLFSLKRLCPSWYRGVGAFEIGIQISFNCSFIIDGLRIMVCFTVLQK